MGWARDCKAAGQPSCTCMACRTHPVGTDGSSPPCAQAAAPCNGTASTLHNYAARPAAHAPQHPQHPQRTMVRKAGTASWTLDQGILQMFKIISAPTRINAGPVASGGEEGGGGRVMYGHKMQRMLGTHMPSPTSQRDRTARCPSPIHTKPCSILPGSQGGTVASRGEKKRAMKKKKATWRQGVG